MAKVRLTVFSKLLIIMVIVGGVFFGFNWLNSQGYLGDIKLPDLPKISSNTEEGSSDDAPEEEKEGNSILDFFKKEEVQPLTIGQVEPALSAGGVFFNTGFSSSETSRYYKTSKINVAFKNLNTVSESLVQFQSGEVNLLNISFEDFLQSYSAIKSVRPKVIFQTTQSESKYTILSKGSASKLEPIKGKRVAVVPNSTSYIYLLHYLDDQSLTKEDIIVLEVQDEARASTVFKDGVVDVTVVSNREAEKIANTHGQTYVLNPTTAYYFSSVLIASSDWMRGNSDNLQKVYDGWMRGSSEISSNDYNKRTSIQQLLSAENVNSLSVNSQMTNQYLLNHGDNEVFLDKRGEALYNQIYSLLKKSNVGVNDIPMWDELLYPNAIQSSTLAGKRGHDAVIDMKTDEQSKTKTSPKTIPAIEGVNTSEALTISFKENSASLDNNANFILKLGAKRFGDYANGESIKILITGFDHTQETRENLSAKRAAIVKRYVIENTSIKPSDITVRTASTVTDKSSSENQKVEIRINQ